MSIFRIHGAFDEAGAASVSLIDLNNINPFLNPLEYTLNLVSYDTSGDYLKYFIHLDYTYEGIFNPVESFLSGLNLTGSNLYFNGSSTYQFVIDAILAQITNPSFVSVMENDPFSMIVLEDLNEDISLLIHYFNTYHLDQTVWQHYFYDTLSTTLSGVNHLSPYSYAKEMEEELGVNFPDLSGCPPDSLYMLASSYNLYGSSRLGVMDAQKPRQDGDNTFSRKLGAKQYELTDYLGNVMATISDKKLHPQELVPLGSQNIDTSIGFQPEVTGRYDYYPFGMEIMSRSGNFTNIDYTTDVTELLYSGLLKDCDNYDLITTGNIAKHCITAENLYGQEYVDTIRIDRPVATYFNFTVDLPLDEVIGEIDPEGNYSIQFTFTSEGRWVYDWPGITGIESIDDNPDATLNEIRAAKVKYLTFHYTGAELNNLATNGIIEYRLQGSNGQSGTWDPFVKINNIRVTQTFENTTVPLAMRDEKGYERGYNGQIKLESVSGPGGHLTAPFWEYNPRVVHRWQLDPKPNTSFSPYAIMQGNPIMYSDPMGDTVEFANPTTEDVVKTYLNKDHKNYDKEFAAKYQELDKSKDIFTFNQIDGKGGNLDYDGESILINFGSKSQAPNISVGATLFEETEHAIQALYGEIGFLETDNGDFITVGLDQIDEANGFVFGSTAPGNFNSGIIKDINKAIDVKDLRKMVSISTGRHPDYKDLPMGPNSAAEDVYNRFGLTRSNMGNRRHYIKPLRIRETPMTRALR